MSESFRFADVTTIGVGGGADRVERVESAAEVADALGDLDVHDELLVLGGGSNIVVADEGFDGVVLLVRGGGVRVTVQGEAAVASVDLTVDAGVIWDDLVARSVTEGWGGLESLSGIPGRVGASVIQNIGAYGHEIGEVLVAVDIVEIATGQIRTVSAADLGLGYRTSAFKRGELDAVVTALHLRLSADGLSAPIRYAQLADGLGVAIDARVPVAAVRQTVLELRRSKGMVFDPADPDTRGCGSFFTNPIVHARFAQSLPPGAPRWPVESQSGPEPATAIPLAEYYGDELQPDEPRPPALVKLSAGWLIEHSGVTRGFSLPGSHAAISSRHTLAITNRGGATASEIVQLAGYVQTRVANEFGVALQPEPLLIGFVES